MTKRFYLLNYNNYPIYDSLNDKEYNAQFKAQREKLCLLLNELHEENQKLKDGVEELNQICEYYEGRIKELKERNSRQAKRLDNLYHLIEEKDWRTLSDIMDDFKQCEEQLQRESGTYW